MSSPAASVIGSQPRGQFMIGVTRCSPSASTGGKAASMGRNVLVVSTVEHAEGVLRARLGADVDEVKVVVPVVQQGFLDWIANKDPDFHAPTHRRK